MADAPDDGIETFAWQCGSAVIKLAWREGMWTVVLITSCRLLGPPQEVYRGSHENPLHAVWDLQARVELASHDEEEGLRAGFSAVRWLREQPPPHASAPRARR